MKRTYSKGGVGQLQVAVAGRGALLDLRHLDSLDSKVATSITRLLGPKDGAIIWASATPFVPPRHLKNRGRNTLQGQILAELKTRGLPDAAIEVLPWTADVHRLRHVVRSRRPPAPQPPVDAALLLRLRFSSPILGPLCLGYASHFGLGRFSAE